MCTAASLRTKDFYMGRNLDYEFSYGESITVTPRNYRFGFEDGASDSRHYAVIGMAHVSDGYPLYYDAVNECGLGIAGLNFVGNAHYGKPEDERINVAQYEFVPWLLRNAADLEEARRLLRQLNITDIPFSDKLPTSQLHWMIADKTGCITVESVSDGLKVYDNPVGVLTNNPPFPEQLFMLSNYMSLSPKDPENRFSSQLGLETYSRGMGAIGLPGDLSSASRFAKAAFTKLNSVSGDSEEESVGQFFHILGSVDQQRGCCELPGGKYEITIYSSCWNADRGIYYYTTYNNRRINAVDMHRENLDGDRIISYPMLDSESFNFQN